MLTTNQNENVCVSGKLRTVFWNDPSATFQKMSLFHSVLEIRSTDPPTHTAVGRYILPL